MTKVAGKNGKSYYAILKEFPEELGDKYTRVLHDALMSIDQGQNIIVIHTVRAWLWAWRPPWTP